MLLMIVLGVIVLGAIFMLSGSDFAPLIEQAILENREIAFTVLILLVFKLFQKKLDLFVKRTDEEIRDKYGFVFLFLLGYLLISARHLTWWGKELPTAIMSTFGITFMLIPVIILVKFSLSSASDKLEEIRSR